MRGKQGPRHLFIPDTQVRPDVSIDHIAWAARYAAVKKPDTIVLAGDWFDLPSLSLYDKGQLAAQGRRYKDDINAGNKALALFDRELKKHSSRGYTPHKMVTLGNHEMRCVRATEMAPELFGKLSLDDMEFAKYGWKVHPFLKPVERNGVTFLHYCPLNAQGKVGVSKYGAPSALAQGRRMMRSTVCGHKQGLDTAVIETPGRTIRSVIAGSFYEHDEDYLTLCGTQYWRGLLVLNDIQRDGSFDLCEVSLPYLRRRFG